MEIRELEKKLKREKYLDYIKIIASFLVVVLHTISIGLEENKRNIGLIVYYIGVFCNSAILYGKWLFTTKKR